MPDGPGPALFAAVLASVAATAGCERWADVSVERDAVSAAAPGPSRDRRPSARSTETLTNGLGMEFALVPAGEFRMGADAAASIGPHAQCESPRHRVRISRDFWCGRHEVTVGQFRRFVEATGYVTEAERTGRGANGLDPAAGTVERRAEWVWRSPGFPQTDRHPVVCTSWRDAAAFCAWLSEREGRRYRLPTEAEWEYACRAGTETRFSTGAEPASLRGFANAGDAALQRSFPTAGGTAAWDDGHAFTAAVGSFRPNAFGLYDVHGNVGEWCGDWFDAEWYARSPETDPTGPEGPREWRVVRGGSWYNTPTSCRSSGRHDGVRTAASTTNGFRVVLETGPAARSSAPRDP